MPRMLQDEFSHERTTHHDAHANAAAAAFLERLEELGEDQLDRFLAHVRTTVPFYQRLVSGGAELARIDQFPIVTREEMRASPDQFLSTAFSADELASYTALTSGTLGPSFEVRFDRAAFFDIHCFSWARIADAIPGMIDRLRIPGDRPRLHVVTDRRSFTRRTLHNPALGGQSIRYWPIGELDAVDDATVAELRAAEIDILVGKPHVLQLLARLDAARPGKPIRPRTLLTAAEKLYDTDLVRLRDHFACAIVDAYSATETGLIGVACQHRAGHHVQTDRVVLEILTEDGEVREDGTGTLLVTNLMNWGQPFVRYRLDDFVTLRWAACACGFEGPTLDVVGRDVRSYTVPSIGQVSAAALADILDRPEVEQFQVAQDTELRLAIRWVAAANVDPTFERELERELRALLAAEFTLRSVASAVEPGGKILRFITEPRL
jgi:phenylacetate-CoA ligase